MSTSRVPATVVPLVRSYRWTRNRKIKFTICEHLFHGICDGLGSDDDRLLAEVWKRIDRDLKSIGLDRDALTANLTNHGEEARNGR